MSEPVRPNVLIVVADDLGYSDLGCYGGEINTPCIDQLAAEGLRFSDYHTSPLCAPTRAMLLSGTDCHLAGLGVMSENASHNPEWRGRPGFEGYLNRDVVTLPELLQEGGYHTMMAGKWHLGYKRGAIPVDRGFDRSYTMLAGAENHFAWGPDWASGGFGEQPRVASHNLKVYLDGERKITPPPNTTEARKGYYSSDAYANTLISYLREWKQDRPFFAYLPFSAPHQPIQCYKEDRDKYKGKYDQGPDVLRSKRLKGLADLGFIDPEVVPHDVVSKNRLWDELSAEEQKLNARSYECYAGMVEALDRATGRVIDYLKEIHQLDNTLVMFFSDNGPEGASCELQSLAGVNLRTTIEKFYDNSYENQGAYNSFVQPGPRWAQASTAPNRLYKHVTTEGGIRVPLVVRYPQINRNHAPGSISHAFTTVMDIMPTILTLAGISHPNATPSGPRAKSAWKDTEVFPMRGRDWCPYLLSGQSALPAAQQAPGGVGRAKLLKTSGEDTAVWGDEPVGWEMHGKAAVRHGKWKIVNLPLDFWGTAKWQLYDLEADQGETSDLSEQYPEKLEEMLGYWAQYQKETGAYLRREQNDLPPPIADAHGKRRPGQEAWMKVADGSSLTVGAI